MNPVKRMNLWKTLADEKGFSLVEFVVVLMVLGIVGGVMFSRFDDVQENAALSNAVYQFKADLQYAQEMAITHNREVDFILNTSSNRYEAKWHDTGTYIPSSQNNGDFIVTFECDAVAMTGSELNDRPFSFSSKGVPQLNGARIIKEMQVMEFNDKILVVIYPSGRTKLIESVG